MSRGDDESPAATRGFSLPAGTQDGGSWTFYLRPLGFLSGAVAEPTQRWTPVVEGRIVGGSEACEPRGAACWRPPPEAPVDRV